MSLLLDPADDPIAKRLAHDVRPLPGFAQAASVVLDYLRASHGLGLWMVTRTAGEDWIVLGTSGQAYPVAAGDVFRWSDSFCSRMVHGEGPRVAPRAQDVPAYAAAPIAQAITIGTYVGIPLTGPDGELFGTLCAVDPEPSNPALADSQPLFELQARLLSSLLAVELTANEHSRRADVAEQAAFLDSLTGLLSRRAWDRLLAAEQERCHRYGSPAAVIVLDLDGLKTCNDEQGHAAGDRMLAKAGAVLARSGRMSDLAARTGGDEFAVLCTETPEAVATSVARRMQASLADEGIHASVGVSGLDPRDGVLAAAWQRADAGMYADKRRRKGAGCR